MTEGRKAGRPRKYHAESLCERLEKLKRIFRKTIMASDWERMHRPMVEPGNSIEEDCRKREYASILLSLNYSEFVHRCEPSNSSGYPTRILNWQYEEGLLAGLTDPSRVVELRSEYAGRLARYMVAEDAGISEDALRKQCARYWNSRP